jgi:hypothetical protein
MSNLVDYLEEVSMRRNFFTAFAGVVSFLMIGAMTADAADITFGGRIRPRYEYWDLKTRNADSDAQFVNMMVRLQAKAKIDDNTSAFIQLQSNSRFGADNGGFGQSIPGSPGQPNDTTTDVGIHQAYFTLNKLFGAPIDLQLGRQQLILDGHRLFGNTVWTQGMQSHDALRLTHSHDNLTLLYAYSKGAELAAQGEAGAVFGGPSSDDVDDVDVHIMWANYKGLIGDNSSTSAYLVLVDQDCNSTDLPDFTGVCGSGTGEGTAVGSADFWTIGARQAGGMGDISYRGEFYYQTGKSNIVGTSGHGDLDAFMIGLRAGYTAKNVAMKPSITLWYDYLSGSSASDIAQGDQGDFRTLFDTGHKFYGLQDILLTQTGPSNTQTGLIDLAIKLQASPMANLTVKVDLHSFTAAEDNAAGNDDIGEEIDVTLVHKYSPNVKMILGYSYFMGDSNNGYVASNYSQAAGADEDASWVYAMLHLKF